MAYAGAVFAHDHNWETPLVERLTWLTTVLPHRDSSEQRYQARLHPRRQLEYGILPLSALELQRLENFFRRYQHESILLPIWTDNQSLAVAANSGQPIITINTATYDFDAGAYAVLWRNYDDYEAVEIQSLTSSAITLAENLTRAWSVGTQVLPARLATLSQSLRGQHYGACARPWKFQFDVAEGSLSTNRVTTLSPTAYKGVDTLGEDFTDLGDGALDFTYDHPLTVVDAQTGVRVLDAGAARNTLGTFAFEKLLTSRAEISAWWGLLARRQGQRVPLYVSLGGDDFEVINGSAGALTYRANGAAKLFNDQAIGRDLCFTVTAPLSPYAVGERHYARVATATDNGDGTETMAAAVLFPFFATTGNVGKYSVSWGRYCRLAGDVQELAWLTGCAARTAGAFTERYDVPA